jgi:general secretion pathway protein K
MRPGNSNIKNRASILIIALWSVSLLTIMAVSLGFQVRQKLILVKRLDERDKVRLIAEAGVRKAISQLNLETEEKYTSLNQKWSSNPEAFKEVAVGEGMFSVICETGSGETRFGLVDEESKININKASVQVMARLFNLAGLDESEAGDLASSIVDWRDEDSQLNSPGGGEDSYYRLLPEPYEAKNAPFQALDELLLVKGVNENIFQKIRKYITIYGNGRVNINTAAKPVLMAVGYSENIADRIIAFRNGKDALEATVDDNYFEATSDVASKISGTANLSQEEQAMINNIDSEQMVTVLSDNFSVTAQAKLERSKFVDEVVSVINRKGDILYWHES